MKNVDIYEKKSIIHNSKINYINIIEDPLLKIVIGFNHFSQNFEIEFIDVKEAWLYLKKNCDLGYVSDYKFFYENSEYYLTLDPDPEINERSDKDGLVVICSDVERRFL